MLKMIQKRMTVVLIVSMLLQLFAGATPVLAEGSSDLIAELEFVAMLAVTLSPGETIGATSATVTDYVYGNLLVNITEQEIAIPRIGDTAPTTGDNLIAYYKSGADITAGVAAGNYLQIYDVDMEDGAQIVAFYQAELTEEDIKEDIEEGAEEEPSESQMMDAELMAEGGYTYIDENGDTKFTGTKTVTRITSGTATLNGGWYIVEGNINRTGTITVNGNVHLILADSSSLFIIGGEDDAAGIYVPYDSSLAIYAQSRGDKMGSLNVSGGYRFCAGIGGSVGIGDSADPFGVVDKKSLYSGDITINGGRVIATGGGSAAGIGGGAEGYSGKITINGGTVTATGGRKAAGIGGGAEGYSGEITINGGTVTATGGGSAAGIGGGDCGDSGNVTINNGKVTAIGGSRGAGIGGGARGSFSGEITINGGIVTAIGGDFAAGIGGGFEGSGGAVIINNYPTVIATGKVDAADIGNGRNGSGITSIKRGDVKGTDLTYVRLEVQNLSFENENKITLNEQEHVINNEGITGFFLDRPTQSIYISLDPAGLLININPGDVHNSRIILNAHDYDKPVAGFGSALNFPANFKSWIKVPFENTKIGGDSDFTISMWIFPRENEPYQTLYRQEGDGKGTLGLDFRFIKYNDDEGYLYFGFNSQSYGWQNAFPWNDETSLANITKIPVNRWTHVALTKLGNNITLYANGTKYYEMTLDSMHYNAPAPLGGNISIGGTTQVNQFFSGRMDEIQFWNTALTPDEIVAWMYRGIDISHNKYNNLVYYYKLNQNSGSIVTDSKESYDGFLVNRTSRSWVVSDVRGWTVDAGSILNGELVGSYADRSSNDGTDWNLTFEIVEQAKKGRVTITGGNKFEYCTNDMNQEGHDSFTYRVKGPSGKYSNTETVNINITPKTIQNRPPTSDDSDRHEKPEKDDAKLPVYVPEKKADVVTTTREGDKTVTTVVIDDKKVEEELEQKGSNAIVTVSDTSGADTVIGTLNGQTVKNMESKDAVLGIKTSQATYTLPASQINIDAVSKQMGKQVELKDIEVSIKISEPASDTVKIIEDTAEKNNYQIIVKPIEFEITCTSGSKTVEVSKFSAYVESMIAIPEGVDQSKITTGVMFNSDGTLSPVPTITTMIDGKYYAKINSLTNSVYSVIYSPKTFKDVEKHWAKEAVNDMGSRLVISGTGKDNFEPDRDITRAEFAAIAVRALGLKPEKYKYSFSDVKAGEWYSEYISTSSYYGLVRGYDDGTFKPEGNITHQEAMAILARAMDTTRLGEKLDIDANDILAAFNDNTDISDWAKDFVSKCVKTGVVTGRGNDQIAPLDSITRVEAVIMVRRLLSKSGLINE